MIGIQQDIPRAAGVIKASSGTRAETQDEAVTHRRVESQRDEGGGEAATISKRNLKDVGGA